MNIHYTPEAENIKIKLSRWLTTKPQFIHLVYSKTDALLTLVSYITENHETKRIISLRGLEHYTDKFKKFFPLSQFLTIDSGLSLEQISNELRPGDLFIISNPIPYIGCLYPVKRILNLCQRIGCYMIFDLSLSYFWLGYDLQKTALSHVIFSLNPLEPDSSPVAIIAPELHKNFILGQVKNWPYNIDLSDETKLRILKTLSDLGQRLDKLLLNHGFIHHCDKQIPTHRTYSIPEKINPCQLSAILQYTQIAHYINTDKKLVCIKIYGLTKQNLQEFDTIINKIK